MNDKISRLAKGILDPAIPEPIVPASVRASVPAGGTGSVEIGIESGNGIPFSGLVYSDSIRVRIPRPSFSGKNIKVTVTADTWHQRPGDTTEGTLLFVTDGGERRVPFVFTAADSTAGEILTSFQDAATFAAVAEADPEAALRIFSYEGFLNAPFMKELKLRALYDAFRSGPDRASAMEQFLVAAGGKLPAEVKAETEKLFLEADRETEGEIRLSVVRKGCFRLSVRAEGSFLKVGKRSVTSEEMKDGTFLLTVAVNPAALHAGKNEGAVRFTSQNMNFSVPVTVYQPEDLKTEEPDGAEETEAERLFSDLKDEKFRADREAVKLLLHAAWESGYRDLRDYAPYEALFEEKDALLTALCGMLIRTGESSADAFRICLEGVKRRISLNGLAEHLVLSMPENMTEPLPHEVFLYFIYDCRLNDRGREMLYENLCRNRRKESALWKEYRKPVETFALEKLLAGKVDRHLAVLYRQILCGELLDKRLAAALPAVLRAKAVYTDAERVEKAVVVCPELADRKEYPLENGTACMPLWTEDSVILFTDRFGNRFADVPRHTEDVCSMPELADPVRLLDPDGPSALLDRIVLIASDPRAEEENGLTEAEVKTLTEAFTKFRLSDPFREKLTGILFRNSGFCTDFLMDLDPEPLTDRERCVLFSVSVGLKDTENAGELAGTYLTEKVPAEDLARFCSGQLKSGSIPDGERLLKLCAKVFAAGKADDTVLSFLCRNFNGAAAEMKKLLTDAERADVGTGDLRERILARQLFAGDRTDLPETAEQYLRDGGKNTVLANACLTFLSFRYFTEELPPAADVFETLADRCRSGTGKTPAVWRLALTRYYAEKTELTETEKTIAGEILNGLLDEGLRFPYYKNLSKFIALPTEVTDRTLIMFRGDAGRVWQVRFRILPDHTEEVTMTAEHVWYDYFAVPVVLFCGETLEYEVLAADDAAGGPVMRGTLTAEEEGIGSASEAYSRFAGINRMVRRLEEKNEAGLREDMEEFAVQEDLAAELFPAGS